MPRFRLLGLFLLVLAAWVAVSSQTLPSLVASHFDASGKADGYMPRGVYTAFVSILVAGAPLLVALLPYWVIRDDGTNLNIPNKQYWLAPERRETTLALVRGHGRWLAAVVALFL